MWVDRIKRQLLLEVLSECPSLTPWHVRTHAILRSGYFTRIDIRVFIGGRWQPVRAGRIRADMRALMMDAAYPKPGGV